MSWTLLKGTLYQRRTGLIWYSVGLASYAAMMAWFYEYLAKVDIESYLKMFPKGFIEFFAGSAISMSTFGGFVSAEFMGFMWVLIAGAAIMTYAVKAISGEIGGQTMELLLTQPLSRSALVLTRIVGMLVVDALIVVATVVPMWLVVLWRGYEGIHFGALAGVAFLLLAAVGGVTLAASSASRSAARPAGIVGGLLGVMWMTHALRDLADWADSLEVVNLFRYWEPARLMNEGTTMASAWWVLGAIAVVSCAVAVVIFARRDVT